jgi:hypothetical protein
LVGTYWTDAIYYSYIFFQHMTSFYTPKFKRFGKKSLAEFLNMKRPFYTIKNKSHLVAIQKKSNNQIFNAFWIMSMKFESTNQAWGSRVLDNLNYNFQFTNVHLIVNIIQKSFLGHKTNKVFKRISLGNNHMAYTIYFVWSIIIK